MFSLFKRSNSSQPKPPTQQSPSANTTRLFGTPSPQNIPQQFYCSELKLRENFAEELLNLEMEVEQQTVTMECVSALLNLYREAVEYFEAIQSNKYLIFKNKIQQLLTKKNVVLAMKLESVQRPVAQRSDEKAIDEQKQKELKIKLNYLSTQDHTENVTDMITEHSERQEKVNQMINNDIQEQSTCLQKRLQQRRNNSIKRDQTLPQLAELQAQPQVAVAEFNVSHTPIIRSNQQKAYTARGRVNQNIDS